MSLSSPITVTVDGVDLTFDRQSEAGGTSQWFCQDGTTSELQLLVRHSEHKPNGTYQTGFRRHNVQLTRLIYATPTTAQRMRKQYHTFERELGDIDLLDVRGLLNFLLSAGFLETQIVSQC
jgi:hypothetical protein